MVVMYIGFAGLRVAARRLLPMYYTEIWSRNLYHDQLLLYMVLILYKYSDVPVIYGYTKQSSQRVII